MKRSWFQFRLSTLLLVVVIIAQQSFILHLQIELRNAQDAVYEVTKLGTDRQRVLDTRPRHDE
jgi:hypothetical protein